MSTTTATPSAVNDADRRSRRDWSAWVSLTGRVVLVAVLVYAASSKVVDPPATVRAVRAYKILPEDVAVPFAHSLPWVELALAALLLVGIAVRLTGLLTTLLLAAFVAGMASAWARGLKIDCGCFGGGGQTDDPAYLKDLLRDASFLLTAGLVTLLPRSRLALDPAVPPPAPDASGGSRRERQAAALQSVRRERALGKRRRFRWLAVGIVVLSVLVGLVAGAAGTPGPSTTPRGSTSLGGQLVGKADAPHRVVLYEDPQCPVCKTFEQTGGIVLAEAVARGLVRVEYRMRSFLGPESVRAVAALGAAADEGRFEALREQLFLHQPEEGTGGYTVDDLLALGRDVGLTSSSYQEKVRNQWYAPWARRTDDAASRAGNVGTPELVLDGTVVPLKTTLQPSQLAPLLGLSASP